MRPNVGRDVAARICRSTEQLRPTAADCKLSSFQEDHPEAQFSRPTTRRHHRAGRTEWRPVDTSGSPSPEQILSIGSPLASPRFLLIGGSSQFASWCGLTQRSPDAFGEQVPDVVGEAEKSDTESLHWSIAGAEVVVRDNAGERFVDVGLPRSVVLRMALSFLDDVDMVVVFCQRAAVMKTFAQCFQNAMKFVLEKANWGNHRMDTVRQQREQKVFQDVVLTRQADQPGVRRPHRSNVTWSVFV